MAATTSLGIVPESLRKSQRLSFGDLSVVLDAAIREHRAGNLNNALAAYREVLGQWLRLSWIERSGRVRTTITDPDAFLMKLRSGGHIDKWSFATIDRALSPPPELSYRVVDITAGIVRGVCSDRTLGIDATTEGLS